MGDWSRLVRFRSKDGKVYQGDAILESGNQDVEKASTARVIYGDPFGEYTWGPVLPIVRLLSPLSVSQVHTVRCLGLNYKKHAQEANMSLPKYPIVIMKPATAINGPYDVVKVPPMAQAEGAVDYEVELVVVVGKKCRNVSAKDAGQYIAGYTVGNDVSQREWQLKRGGSQWNVSKMFDGWAPLGPAIVAPGALPKRLEQIRLRTWINGELRQSELAGDMVFGPHEALSFISQGSTLLPGDLIFLGTPSGVGMGFSPPKWLKNGDQVECSIEGIGKLHNRIEFSDIVEPLSIEPPTQPARRKWLFSRL